MAARASLAILPRSCLAARLRPLADDCITLWNDTPAVLPQLGPHVPWRRRLANGRATARVIDELGQSMEAYPAVEPARRAWRDTLRRRLEDFGEAHLGWPAGYRRLLFGDAFYESSVSFARQARGFDPTMRLEDLFQALRNVWIGNSLQMLLAAPLKLTPGLFAYSMLYPATDNLLDATAISSDAKRAFNFRLGQRLMGTRCEPQNESERRVFALVGRIEEEFSRDDHPDVWESILAIHRGQIASLRQQEGTLSVDQLLALSVAKGGASVLADAYLISGGVSPEDEQFAFRYGVFLQLLDDLQDVDTDLVNGHHTLFTHAARRGLLDEPAMRLAQFIDVVLGAERFRDAGLADCADLIRRNCRALLVGVMAEQPERFSRSLRRVVEGQWPIGFRAMRRLRRHAMRRFDAAARHVQALHRGASPLQLVLE